MRLSQQTDYALRVLMLLVSSERQHSVDEIALAYGISEHHLMKVAQRLKALGYVAARRGRGGGIALAVAPEAINVGKLVRQFESMTGFVECFAPTSRCPIVPACGLQGALRLALNDFLARLDSYSLSDLVPDRTKLLSNLNTGHRLIALTQDA
jgi:Rrf2 family transcriptional regulator, nitric oxide-sensitive transcriptional repressor